MFKTLHVCGKRPGLPSIAMAVGHKTRLLYAQDLKSERRFLVDTGTEVSVFPATRMDRKSHFQGTKLTAANGSNICTYGERTISLIFSKRHFRWTFTIAQVTPPLLGADFLRAHSLLVDIKGSMPWRSFRLYVPHSMQYHRSGTSPRLHRFSGEFAKLRSDFPDVTMPSFSNSSPKHGVEIFIPTNGPPHHARAWRLPLAKLQLAKDEFRKMEELGIIRRSNSQWSSPLHMVP